MRELLIKASKQLQAPIKQHECLGLDISTSFCSNFYCLCGLIRAQEWTIKVIIVMLDSFRQDHGGYYKGGQSIFEGIPACQTPNLNAFSEESIVSDNASA